MRKYTVKRFFQRMGVVASGAAVFGLVAGGAFTGVTKLTGAFDRKDVSIISETPVAAIEDKNEKEGNRLLTTTTVDGSTAEGAVAAVAKEVMPSIVAITAVSEAEYLNMFGQHTGQTYESEAAGSGIIVAQDQDYLYVATNNHVVTGSKALTIQFLDNSTAPGEIQGTDSKNDLAVVKVALSDLDAGTSDNIRVATLGDSDQIQVGETAIAIGNALGYGQSVTTGIISATEREVTAQDAGTGQVVTSTLLQTDAAINPGNSGGALLNAKGAVIGINSSKYSDTAVEGMGFAIPVNTAKEIIEAIIDGNLEELQLKAGYLGVSGLDIGTEDAEKYNMPQGVYIAKVESGSAAEQAGLRVGQIITKIDGKEITTASQLAQTVQSHKGGDTLTITVATADNGSYPETDVTVTLQSQADRPQSEDPAAEEKMQDPAQRGEQSGGQGESGQQMPPQNGGQEEPDMQMPQQGNDQPGGYSEEDIMQFFQQFMR